MVQGEIAQFDAPSPRAEVLRRTIAEMGQKLDRYRDALEAGTNPALIVTWTAEVESAKAAAETELAVLGPSTPKPIRDIPALIASIRQEWGTMAEALGAADGTRRQNCSPASASKSATTPSPTRPR